MAQNNNNRTGSGYNPFADNVNQQESTEVGHSPYNPFTDNNHDTSTPTEHYSPSDLIPTNDLIDLQQGLQSPEQAVSSSSRQPLTSVQDPSSAHFRINRKSKQGNTSKTKFLSSFFFHRGVFSRYFSRPKVRGRRSF